MGTIINVHVFYDYKRLEIPVVDDWLNQLWHIYVVEKQQLLEICIQCHRHGETFFTGKCRLITE